MTETLHIGAREITVEHGEISRARHKAALIAQAEGQREVVEELIRQRDALKKALEELTDDSESALLAARGKADAGEAFETDLATAIVVQDYERKLAVLAKALDKISEMAGETYKSEDPYERLKFIERIANAARGGNAGPQEYPEGLQ